MKLCPDERAVSQLLSVKGAADSRDSSVVSVVIISKRKEMYYLKRLLHD